MGEITYRSYRFLQWIEQNLDSQKPDSSAEVSTVGTSFGGYPILIHFTLFYTAITHKTSCFFVGSFTTSKSPPDKSPLSPGVESAQAAMKPKNAKVGGAWANHPAERAWLFPFARLLQSGADVRRIQYPISIAGLKPLVFQWCQLWDFGVDIDEDVTVLCLFVIRNWQVDRAALKVTLVWLIWLGGAVRSVCSGSPLPSPSNNWTFHDELTWTNIPQVRKPNSHGGSC